MFLSAYRRVAYRFLTGTGQLLIVIIAAVGALWLIALGSHGNQNVSIHLGAAQVVEKDPDTNQVVFQDVIQEDTYRVYVEEKETWESLNQGDLYKTAFSGQYSFFFQLELTLDEVTPRALSEKGK